MRRAVVGLAFLTVAVTASCTSTAPPTPPSSSLSHPATALSSSSKPVAAGPTTSVVAACPFLAESQAMDIVGVRMDRVTVQRATGQTVGCRFYPVGGAYAQKEKLPPTTQAVLQIAAQRYPDSTSAQNAAVRISRVDPGAFLDPISGAQAAISYVDDFYPPDRKKDNAFVFVTGVTVVVVQLAQTGASLSAKEVGEAIVGKF